MIRDNLKAAINNSGMIVKEVAAKSGVNKRTIDKWVGAEETEPQAIDLYKVCKTLRITMEKAVAGAEGQDYVLELITQEGMLWEPPERIAGLVASLNELSDNELNIIRGTIGGILYGEAQGETTNPLSEKRA